MAPERRRDKDDGRRRVKDEGEERRRRKESDSGRPRDTTSEKRRRDEGSAKDGERRRHKEDEGERRRPKEDEGERRRHKEDEGERRRHKEDEGERRRHKEDSERRRHKEDDGERRHHKDDVDRRRRKDEDNERRHHRDEDGERRRHRDEDGERRRRRDDDGERQRSKENDDERRRHRNEDGERRRPKNDGERRQSKDDDGERRRNRDDDGKRRSHKDEAGTRRHHKNEDEPRRHKDADGERQRHKEEDGRRRRRPEERDNDNERESGPSKTELGRDKSSSKTMSSKQTEDEQNGHHDKEDKYENEDYNYDDDEFEDYDDDFEDDEDQDEDEDNEEKKVWRAVQQENQKLLSPRVRPSSTDSEPEYQPRVPAGGQGHFINFVSAKHNTATNAAMGRVKQRYKALTKLIELDIMSCDIFDMPPVGEYERYILNYGRSNTKQAYVQTNDDTIDRDIQTDDIENRDKWTQMPSDDNKVCGGGGPDDDSGDLAILLNHEQKTVDYTTLKKHILDASRVMAVLLEESRSSGHTPTDSHTQTKFSDFSVKLCAPESLKDAAVVAAHFSTSHSYQLLTAHRTNLKDAGHPLFECGILYVWNVNQPSSPLNIFAVRSQPTCCTFSPGSVHLVFAGCEDGSIVLWDLREPGPQLKSYTLSSINGHYSNDQDNETLIIQQPTYSTAMLTGSEGHQSPIISICPIISAADWGMESLTTGHGNKDEGLSFQLASLEKNGQIFIWVVAEVAKGDIGGSDSELGLAPGGRVRLIKSANIRVDGPSKNLAVTGTCMQILTNDASQFVISTDSGSVIRTSRSSISGTKLYQSEFDSPVRITSLDVSPFGEGAFLVGTCAGQVRLHKFDQTNPVMSWECSKQALISVRWSRSRACVFYVIDESGLLYVYDLTAVDTEPLIREATQLMDPTCLELSCDYSATGLGSKTTKPQILLASGLGVMDVHTCTGTLMKAELDETYQLANYIAHVA